MINKVFIASFCLLTIFDTQAQFRYATNAPIIRKDSIWSKVLNENRRLQFYKPETFPEYADVVSPIVYVLDGDAYIHNVSTILNSLCERLVILPPVNVVAVENSDAPGARERDFAAAPPYASKTEKENNGATKFIRFLRDEVIPYAEKDYKKRPYRIVTSHSFSGWLALQLFVEYPDVFDGYILTDPSMNPDSVSIHVIDSLLKKSSSAKERALFTCSSNEPWAILHQHIIDSLIEKNSLSNVAHYSVKHPNENHFTVYLKSYYEGLHFIFKLEPLEMSMKPSQINYNELEKRHAEISKIFGSKIIPNETLTGYYANRFLNDWNDIDKSLEFFKNNMLNYPANAWLFHQYAEALLKKGDKNAAIKVYEDAYKKHPDDTDARDKAAKLKSER